MIFDPFYSIPYLLFFFFHLFFFFLEQSCVPKIFLLAANYTYHLRKSHPFLNSVSSYLIYNSEASGSFAIILYMK